MGSTRTSTHRLDGFLPWLLALQLAGCAPGVDPGIEQARENLIGVRVKRLSKCLGPPTEIEIDPDGETEHLRFLVLEKKRDPFPPRQPASRPGLPDPASQRTNPETGRPQLGTAYCEMTFDVKDGRVIKVAEVNGRRSDGMGDRACIFQHEICLSRSTTD